MPQAFRKLLKKIDQYGLLACAAVLILMIPLYPKIPLFSPIEQYIVRVRLEDFAVLIAVIFTAIQIFRKKVSVDKKVLILMGAYALAGFLSMLSAMFITKTVPLQPLHVGKTLLHFFRYMEYFSVFFVSFTAIKTKKDLLFLLKLLVIAVFAIGVYGYMQKYFYWPVYSTMNREFSKGIRLVLTEHARIQSTFAGHYDMAAYLVITLPILLSLALKIRSKKKKFALYGVFASGFWLMVMSASRIPFAAILFGTGIVILLHTLITKQWRRKLLFFSSRSAIFSVFLVLILYYFGQNMLDRLSNVISSSDNPVNINKMIDGIFDPLPIPLSTQLLAWLPKAPALPENTAEAPDLEAAMIAQVASISDQPPVPRNPTPTPATERPRDVYEDIPEPVTTEVTLADGTVQRTVIHKTRVYSDCALEHELSLCIRLESLWPWALQSFSTNPILGTGYATLNKQFVDEFTIADSTDNNYLRTLGETGLAGFITFYGLCIFLLVTTIRHLKNTSDPLNQALDIGFIAGTLGLLLNAAYIDVFAASKVAYTFWFMAGLIRASQQLQPVKTRTKTTRKSKHVRN